MKEIFYEILGTTRYSIYQSDEMYSLCIASENEKSFVGEVTSLRETAFEIMELLIRNVVEPIHLKDVLQDLL